jgi:hypothetical protein
MLFSEKPVMMMQLLRQVALFIALLNINHSRSLAQHMIAYFRQPTLCIPD